jgi:Mg-chelatase subunit ChlI
MADPLLDAVVAAEVDLTQAAAMLALLKDSPGVRPSDIRAAEEATLQKREAQQVAYRTHAEANPNDPLYRATQEGFIRMTPEEIEAHLADQAAARQAIVEREAAEQAAFDGKVAASLERLKA